MLTDEYGFSDTCTTEQTNLSTSGVRSQQIYDLDTSLQDLSGCGLLYEGRRLGVDWHAGLCVEGSTLVNGLSDDVDDSSQALWTDRNHDGVASSGDLGASDETLSTC